MENEKTTYMRDNRTPNEFKENVVKYTSLGDQYFKKWITNNKEDITIKRYLAQGREIELGDKILDMNSQEIANNTKQGADYCIWYNYKGAYKQRFIEVKVASGIGKVVALKKSQADAFLSKYGSGNFVYLLFDQRNKEYTVISDTQIFNAPIERFEKIGNKVCYILQSRNLTWKKL